MKQVGMDLTNKITKGATWCWMAPTFSRWKNRWRQAAALEAALRNMGH